MTVLQKKMTDQRGNIGDENKVEWKANEAKSVGVKTLLITAGKCVVTVQRIWQNCELI